MDQTSTWPGPMTVIDPVPSSWGKVKPLMGSKVGVRGFALLLPNRIMPVSQDLAMQEIPDTAGGIWPSAGLLWNRRGQRDLLQPLLDEPISKSAS